MTERGAAELHKLYYRIGEVAGIVGVEPHVLRYWETEFRAIRPQKSRRGQRIYSRRDVERLIRVKDLLYVQGFTIAGARKRLRESGVEPLAELESRSSAAADREVNGVELQRSEACLRSTLAAVKGELEALLVELGAGDERD